MSRGGSGRDERGELGREWGEGVVSWECEGRVEWVEDGVLHARHLVLYVL